MPRQRQKKPSSQRPATGSIRIISGLWRGRKLPVLDAQGLRPTTDRVKETLFNWIAMAIPHAHCLDLFAGSGSLGFEAASRQAKHVTMLELDQNAYRQLQSNRQQVNASNITIHHQDALSYLRQSPSKHDIVFIDPPFRQDLLNQTLQLLDQNWLNDQALVYIETEKELDLTGVPAHWQLEKEKFAGQVAYRLYQVHLDSDSE